MITAYSQDIVASFPPFDSNKSFIWLDLLRPSLDEDHMIEAHCGVDIPTREEMSEIEPSSRLYLDHKTAYLTASVISNVDLGEPKLADISFILSPNALITVRYDEPKSFDIFKSRAQKLANPELMHDVLFANLLDTIIDRSADILEKTSAKIESASLNIFSEQKINANTHRTIIKTVGYEGALISKMRDSLISLSRMLLFVSNPHEGFDMSNDAKAIINTQIRDCEYLLQHCDSLASKITFLLDATLGLVNLEQNSIIKIFSVASVALMPPTLIASIYGMNFKDSPPFEWANGFYISLGFMLGSAILPYIFFKWKKWL
jgi:magnesium transporter